MAGEDDPELAKFFEEIEQTATHYQQDEDEGGKERTQTEAQQTKPVMYSASAVAASAPPQRNPSSSAGASPGPSMPYTSGGEWTSSSYGNSGVAAMGTGGGMQQQQHHFQHGSGGGGGGGGQAPYSNYQWQQGSASTYQQQPGASAMTAASPYQRQQAQPKSGKKHVRVAGGQLWVDPTLEEWPENDFRLFVGDIGNECSDEVLAKSFQKFPSFTKAKVVMDKKTGKTKGYGFVSFLDAMDAVKAMREVNGKYIGNRPCKIKKSRWKERELANNKTVRKEQKMLVQLNKTAKKK
eukprot:gb/GECG01012523.1/.p1 GENE.gb/GECG01012523.1/~~gb/GECG01012523.1/.p1  ORF type:complete len:294 (+),score=57.32 gb/GECG01012523.1/:1-882(+)